MNEKIFLIGDDGSLQSMSSTEYEKEDLLQDFLARYPELLSTRDDDLRFLLVKREMGVPDAEDAGNRWSIDHLFLDQKGVPTLVETKRSRDTRIRREMVGQMLDYAANSVEHWPAEEIREMFEQRCQSQGKDPREVLIEFLRPRNQDAENPVEAFWELVRVNLEAEQVRLVFVSDTIPRELQRVIEFLDGQMSNAEVIGLELRQFLSAEGRRTLVPRVVGRTAKAQQKKSVRSSIARRWDESSFAERIRAGSGAEAERASTEILRWCSERGLTIRWNEGQEGSFIPILRVEDEEHRIFRFATDGTVSVRFFAASQEPPFDQPELRQDLLRRINTIPGVAISETAITGKPTFPLSALYAPDSLRRFLDIYQWFIDAARNSRA